MFIKIFLNMNVGARAYTPGDELLCAWKGQIEGETDKEVLNLTFETFNINHPTDYSNRSLSVGDVVAILADGAAGRCYAVESSGFTAVELMPFLIASEPVTGDGDNEEFDPMRGADTTPDYPMHEG